MNIRFTLPPIDNDYTQSWSFSVVKNVERDGKWLGSFIVTDRENRIEMLGSSAWANAAPAKRWLESLVQSKLPWMSTDDGMAAQAQLDIPRETIPVTEEQAEALKENPELSSIIEAEVVEEEK
jgi:hypothetical protein